MHIPPSSLRFGGDRPYLRLYGGDDTTATVEQQSTPNQRRLSEAIMYETGQAFAHGPINPKLRDLEKAKAMLEGLAKEPDFPEARYQLARFMLDQPDERSSPKRFYQFVKRLRLGEDIMGALMDRLPHHKVPYVGLMLLAASEGVPEAKGHLNSLKDKLSPRQWEDAERYAREHLENYKLRGRVYLKTPESIFQGRS